MPRQRKQKRVRPPQPLYDPNEIVLDPGHGGDDAGADLGSAGKEKAFNLAFANRLKALLEAQQFTVVLTHAAADDDPSPEERAETANRSRAVACLILHATTAGHGVHLFPSALTTPFFAGDPGADAGITPWDSAQAAALPKSLELENELSTALNGLRVPLVATRVSVRPIDSLSCPALAVELAPGGPDKSLADVPYQERLAASLVTGLIYWRDRAKAQIAAQRAAFDAANPMPAAGAALPAPPKPKPKPVTAPSESPLAPDSTAHLPAPTGLRQ